MGLDIYTYMILGVRLRDHCTSEEHVHTHTQYKRNTGKPYEESYNYELTTMWDGTVVTTWRKVPGVMEFNEWRGKVAPYKSELVIVVPEEDPVFSVIGLDISQDINKLVQEIPAITPELIEKARSLLAGIGLVDNVEIKPYVVTRLSY